MKKTLAALTALTLLAGSAFAEETSSLTVTVNGIETVSGTINLGLFDEAGYESGAAVDGAMVAVDGNTVTVSFEGLAPGQYGLKLYHDINDNGQMDTNPFGMPTEPYGFSNNAKGRFGPAKWAQAAFEVAAGGSTHTITMN